MASMVSASVSVLISSAPRVKFAANEAINVPSAGGLNIMPKFQASKAARSYSHVSRRFSTRISCSAKAETLEIVQGIIADQLSIDASTVAAQTKFADMGADSLDTVEIMMALEEKFEVSIGEGGAENIATVQDAADLIEKIKTASS